MGGGGGGGDGDAAVERATRELALLASRKELARAERVWAGLRRANLVPSVAAYAAFANCVVCAGDLARARGLVEEMRGRGVQPNVVVMTTLLKGHATAGDVAGAKKLLAEMRAAGVAPDLRAVNTFLRGCERVGDVAAAVEVAGRMREELGVAPDATTHRLLVRLLSQGLRFQAIKQVMRDMRAREEAAGTRPPGTPPCAFWARGKCDRGPNCAFWHDPALASRQQGAALATLERHDTALQLNADRAHCAALLGKRAECAKAMRRARDAHAAATSAAKAVDGSRMLFQKTRRDELKREVERVAEFQKRSTDAPSLASFLARTFVFSSVLTPEAEEAPEESGDVVAGLLYDALERTLGLDECIRRGNASAEAMLDTVRSSLTGKARFRWRKVFGGAKRARGEDAPAGDLPVKLEICSGSGDWVVAQAKAEVGIANWAALELRHDRVYSIFSRMVLEGVHNLAVVGGDASQVLPRHVAKGSVAHVCINFPEPPHWSGSDEAENRLHLLTDGFFAACHRVLSPGGLLTIFSDNRKYCQQLCTTLGGLRRDGDALFESVEVPGHKDGHADFYGVRLYTGVPGKAEGHAVNVSSYFDRFWEHGNHTDRVFIVVARK